jgi:Ca-activated chloride channel homolog
MPLVVPRIACVFLLLTLYSGTRPTAQDAGQAVFRSQVERVPVATVVRTREGKPVTGLTREDFQLLDGGEPKEIKDFQSDPTPVSLLLLVDLSGSMGLEDKWDRAVAAATRLENFLKAGQDDVGVFTFDRRLKEIAPFGGLLGDVPLALKSLRPFGETSLYDAIAEAGRTMGSRPGARRAVVALTDGEDNASRLTSSQVSALASSIDVPVYVVMVASAVERAALKARAATAGPDDSPRGRLADLAHWTGGELFPSSSAAEDRLAAERIVTELRQQYLIVFEPDRRPGWHSIVIQTRQKDLVVRTRNGYLVGSRSGQD